MSYLHGTIIRLDRVLTQPGSDMSKVPYQRSAKWYDSLIEPFNVSLRQIGLKMCPATEGATVLDVGCGTGTHLDLYQKAGCEVFGIDSSSAMLDVARNKLGQRATLHLGDASQMPYEDGMFDLVIITLTLHEMPTPTRSAVLSEIQRVLKQCGQLLVIDYHTGTIRFPRGWLGKGLITFVEFLAGGEHFRNCREFLATGGMPALSQHHSLRQTEAKIVNGGNIGLYVFSLE